MKYEKPNMLVLELEENDVITTSGGNDDSNKGIGWGEVGGSFGEEFPLQ